MSKTTTGLAYDISAGGLFIACNERPSAGAFANLEIQLPGREPWAQQLRLHGTGRVVRLIEDGARSGFAVASSLGWAISRPRGQMAVKAS